MVNSKSAGIAAVLSAIVFGLGQIYDGKIGRGLGFLALGALVGILTVALILTVTLIGLVFVILYIVVWVWNISDAYKLANEYNDIIASTGRRPW